MPEILKTKRNKTNKSKKSFSPPISYLISALKGLAVALLLLGGLSFIIVSNGSFSAFYKVFSYAAIGFGSFACGFSAYRSIKGRGILNGVIGGGIYCAFIIIVLLCLMRFNVSSNILYLVPISLGCGIAGGITGANI